MAKCKCKCGKSEMNFHKMAAHQVVDGMWKCEVCDEVLEAMAEEEKSDEVEAVEDVEIKEECCSGECEECSCGEEKAKIEVPEIVESEEKIEELESVEVEKSILKAMAEEEVEKLAAQVEVVSEDVEIKEEAPIVSEKKKSSSKKKKKSSKKK